LPALLAVGPVGAADPRPPASAPKKSGSLVIVGGGQLPEAVRDRFLELAGGKKSRIVVIPTASAAAQKRGTSKSYDFWKRQEASSVTLLHTLDRDKANKAEFVKPLTEATAVWLTGGDQERLTSAYRGTAVDRELRKVLERGGVIGGTSAGASAMSSLMIVAGNPDARTGTGFGLLNDVVIDQHFQNRNRLKRLEGILTKHTALLGLGIDEETAVVFKGQLGTVLGKANVRVCLPPIVQKVPRVQVLKAGQEIDLNALREAILKAKK
jgi:cyanophycinase